MSLAARHHRSTDELIVSLHLLSGELDKAAPLGPADYSRKRDELLRRTAAKVRDYAHRVAVRSMTGSQFRDAMTRTLRSAYLASYRLGAFSRFGRSALTPSDYAEVASRLGDDLYYLEAFAALIPGRVTAGDVWSEAYLANRSSMYADNVWALWWAGRVSRNPQDTIYLWRAVGDASTCKFCGDADGSYFSAATLPGLPGDGCAGGPECRCLLDEVDPDTLSPADLADAGVGAQGTEAEAA
jgi:hypothetical protein